MNGVFYYSINPSCPSFFNGLLTLNINDYSCCTWIDVYNYLCCTCYYDLYCTCYYDIYDENNNCIGQESCQVCCGQGTCDVVCGCECCGILETSNYFTCSCSSVNFCNGVPLGWSSYDEIRCCGAITYCCSNGGDGGTALTLLNSCCFYLDVCYG
jgi:hypothetical protein